jgi:hypothetical protein
MNRIELEGVSWPTTGEGMSTDGALPDAPFGQGRRPRAIRVQDILWLAEATAVERLTALVLEFE